MVAGVRVQCIVKDSANFLDHINGKKHQKALGMSMRIERVGLEAVKNRFESNKRKQQQQAERNDDDYETRLIRLQVRVTSSLSIAAWAHTRSARRRAIDTASLMRAPLVR